MVKIQTNRPLLKGNDVIRDPLHIDSERVMISVVEDAHTIGGLAVYDLFNVSREKGAHPYPCSWAYVDP